MEHSFTTGQHSQGPSALSDADVRALLTKDQVQVIRETFKFFDISGSGYITINDMKKVLLCLGVKLTEESVSNFMSHWSDRSVLAFEDFLRVFARIETRLTTSQEMREVFAMLDHDSDGFLEVSRLREAIAILEPDMTDSQIVAMLSNAFPEKNSDYMRIGKLTYEQFIEFMYSS